MRSVHCDADQVLGEGIVVVVVAVAVVTIEQESKKQMAAVKQHSFTVFFVPGSADCRITGPTTALTSHSPQTSAAGRWLTAKNRSDHTMSIITLTHCPLSTADRL